MSMTHEGPVINSVSKSAGSRKVPRNKISGSILGNQQYDERTATSCSERDSVVPKNVCSCCGAELKNQQPHVDLDTNSFLFRDLSVPLTPTQAELLAALAKAFPRTVTYDSLINAVWGVREPSDPKNSLKVHFTWMRRRLRDTSVAIENVLETGYRLVLQ